MKKLVTLLLLPLLLASAYAIDAYVKKSDGTTVTILYADPSSQNLYVEGNVNPDIGVMLQDGDIGGKYVAIGYGMNVSGNIVDYFYSITKTSGQVMAQSDSNGWVQPANIILIDYTLDDPYGVDNKKAGMPGRPWIVVSDDPYLNNSDTFVIPNGGDGLLLKGWYSFNDYERTFNPDTGLITVKVTDIKLDSGSGTVDYLSTLSTEDVLLVGACEDQYGFSCNDGKRVSPDDAESGIVLDTGHAREINDQHPHKMYLIVNGLPYRLNLGADLVVSQLQAPSVIYYGQNFTVNVTVTNEGNVNVTTPFNVTLTFWKNVQGTTYENVTLIKLYNASADPLEPGESVTLQFEYKAIPNGNDAFSKTGNLTIVAFADANNTINETEESNNKRSLVIQYKPAYQPIVEIDGVKTYEFNYSGQPYNVTFSFKKLPDNEVVSSFSFLLVKVGGVNLFVPAVSAKTGVTEIKTTVKVFYSGGSVTIPVIPTKTSEGYGSDEVIYIESEGNKFFDPRTNEVVDRFYLNVSNTSYQGTNEIEKRGLVSDSIVADLFTYIVKIYEAVFTVIQG